MAQYRVLQGIDYPPNKRAEVGQVVSDLPPQSINWLLESGVIEDISKPSKAKEEVKPVIKAEPAKAEEPKVEISKTEESKISYKEDAVDGDGDGLVQDGTKFQRPVGTSLPQEKAGE